MKNKKITVYKLYNDIEKIKKRISKIQEKCEHPKHSVKSINGSNTGNYDPSADSWWTDHHCSICNKKWYTKQ